MPALSYPPAVASPRSLDSFFVDAAHGAEWTIHRIRVGLMVLTWARLAAFQGAALLRGEPKHWITTVVIVVGIAASSGLVRVLRRAPDRTGPLVLSTVLDAALALGIVLPSVVWPRVGYVGVLLAPDFGIWLLVAVGSGFRLSRTAAWAGAVASAVGVLALVGLDLALNAEAVRYRLPEMVLAGVLLGGAAALGLGLDAWMRRLVARGAEHAVRAERARQRLGAYVSNEVAELALREETTLGGQRREVAIVFSDLRGFTRTGEQVGPDELLAQLNAYLEAMVEVIHAHGGVVDKYMGDAILAVFGIPERSGDEARRAVEAALSLQAALEAHNVVRAAARLPPLAHGVGVHYGPVVAGHVGTHERVQYTVIGDTVNVASRLQTATKEFGVALLLSEAVVDAARAEHAELPPLRRLDPLPLRGRSGAVVVYTDAPA